MNINDWLFNYLINFLIIISSKEETLYSTELIKSTKRQLNGIFKWQPTLHPLRYSSEIGLVGGTNYHEVPHGIQIT